MTESMTQAAARRTALAAQGFAESRPSGPPTRRHLAKVLDRVRLLQLDSVNVAVRAHYMPVFSRLGSYDMSLVDDAAWNPTARKPRLLVEYWAHVASLIPVDDWPLLRWRMRAHEVSWGEYLRKNDIDPALQDEVLRVVKDSGPIGAGAIETALGGGADRPKGGWWNLSAVKHTCEYLFAAGALTTGTRRGFQRLYDLPERVLPPELLSREVPDDEAARELMRSAAIAHGIGTEFDLRDYYRLPPAMARQALLELVESGELTPVTIPGWRHPAYLHAGARTPRAVRGRALLCPFDPLVWERDRTERLFDFHYRIEIYVPEPKRQYGYYVFPFLLDGALVGRVDLKADRAAGTLRVHGAFAESGVDVGRVAAELAGELREMAGWLELDQVALGERGDLVAPLSKCL
ncbi:winged helix-turn-helix domain-containing protein [Actinokineospora guangxiensis]|uniref:Winged helix-turn-helix domain-containing protein n=1 Tax=Actinokineospora guangxiensis TaxID=1490288 RepID=A0ABW0ER67_9PSEU